MITNLFKRKKDKAADHYKGVIERQKCYKVVYMADDPIYKKTYQVAYFTDRASAERFAESMDGLTNCLLWNVTCFIPEGD